MIKHFFEAIMRLIFGHNTADNAKDWQRAHDKAAASRAEIEQIIKDAAKNEK